MTYVYLDCETVGLSLLDHDVWEIGFAFDDEPVDSFIVEHSLIGAEPIALEINRYWDRIEDFWNAPSPRSELELRKRMEDERPTLVGANPAFDAYRLSRRWGWATPWRYRFIDVEAYAMPIFGYDIPHGLHDIADDLLLAGYEIPMPDHSAAADVEATRAVFKALVEMGRRERMFDKESK